MVDIGEARKESDGGIFSNSVFGQKVISESLPLPSPAILPDTQNIITPYVFVGDEAFPLRTNLMRPFPGKELDERKAIFNYCLSRATLKILLEF